VAYQSEIELRVKVIDKELKDLEQRIEKISNPFGASGGASKGALDRQKREKLRLEQEILDYVKEAVVEEERLRVAKAKNTQRIKQRLLQIERTSRIKAAQDVAKAERKLARENAKFKENLALGVGFPLLFGGGVGAVAGGALGAVAGRGKDGFGLQILFSSIGQIVDSAFTNLKDSASSVASSLGGTVSTLEALRDVGIQVKNSNIEYIQSLEDSGQAVLAYELVQKRLTDLYGDEGVAALQELKSANEFANTEAGNLTAVLQTELAPVFILLAQVAGVAAKGLSKAIPFIGDVGKGLVRQSIGLGPAGQALGVFNLVRQIEGQRPKRDQGRVDAGARDAAFQAQGQIRLNALSGQNDSLIRANELIKAGNDLTDERIVGLRKIDIIEKASTKIQQLDAEIKAMGLVVDEQRKKEIELEQEIILQKKKNELAQLGVDVERAKAQAAEKAERLLKNQAKAADRLRKAAEREQRKISKLENQLKLGEELLVLDEKLFQARLEEDRVLEASLEKQRVQAELETKIADLRAEGLGPVREARAIALATLNAKRSIAKVDQSLTRSNVEDKKSAAAKLKSLQDEGALLQARLDGRLEEVQLDQQIEKILETNTGLTREQVEAALRGNQVLKEQVSALEELESMYAAIGQSISTGIVDALSAAVEGTKSLADVASQVLRQVANILLQFGVNTALGGIPGLSAFFPGRAAGGPVTGGKPYMVGEKGPELFVPNSSGNIVPNNKLGGGANVVVNVDAKGTSASGDSAAGKQLGGLIGAAVQSEIVKQQRPGGLLAR
jgi:hypothetical protein